MGYMGCGKSAVSEVLSVYLGYPALDLDTFIEQKEGCSISELFENKGAIYFRKAESKYLQELLQTSGPQIIALGGGTPCYSNNMELLKSQSDVVTVYLKGSINLLADRLWTERKHRPLIANIQNKQELLEFIGKHLFERVPYYSQANHTVAIDAKSIDEIVDEIKEILL